MVIDILTILTLGHYFFQKPYTLPIALNLLSEHLYEPRFCVPVNYLGRGSPLNGNKLGLPQNVCVAQPIQWRNRGKGC